MANSIFVSPGVYTRERDLTFVVKQIGVTTLGMAGETPVGPAFENVFISNYEEYMAFFGGLNPEKYKGNGYPKYESGYIAKQYLTQSNQLYVTRVLGLSGYDAGKAFALTLIAGGNPSTFVGGNISSQTIMTFTVDNTTKIIAGVTPSSPLAAYYTAGVTYSSLVNGADGSGYWSSSINPFTGTSSDLSVITLRVGNNVTTFSAGTVTFSSSSGASTSTVTLTGIPFTGTSVAYTGYDGTIVAILRSRGLYNSNEVLNYSTSNITVSNAAEMGIYNEFTLTGSSGNTYTVSLDPSKRSIIDKVLGIKPFDASSDYFVEFLAPNLIKYLVDNGIAYGLSSSASTYSTDWANYTQGWGTPETPYIVSEVRGSKVFRLFKFIMISDGDSGNKLVKLSIANVKPDIKEFDLLVRDFNDSDLKPLVYERFNRLTMDETKDNFIGRVIGTTDGKYTLRSKYVMLEMATDFPQDSFPCGFEGVLVRDVASGDVAPKLLYKTSYSPYERVRKAYLGISDHVGIDQNMFNYLGKKTNGNCWTSQTTGFHLDYRSSGVTVDNATLPLGPNSAVTVNPTFESGSHEFSSESSVAGTSYEPVSARKFTFAPYGGFDGWDIYRTSRTNTDRYRLGGVGATNGLANNVFSSYVTEDGTIGLTSDWYAYYESIKTFNSPESIDINVFTTPGIDTYNNITLVDETIDMIENQRGDSIYIVTTPDKYSYGDLIDSDEVIANMDGLFDSNYTATFYPWIKMQDSENNVLVWLPPTLEVVRNIALTDNVAFPWFGSAGVDRGNTSAITARFRLNHSIMDDLYANRINPMATFAQDRKVLIWGNKNLQVADSALNRLNVRRLLIQTRKLISAVSIRLIFDQNDQVIRNKFISLVNPILDNIRQERGMTDFRVVVSNDVEDYDRNEMKCKIYIKPTRALEYIIIDFILTPTGVSFDTV